MKPSLSISYALKKKAKKMADGGDVKSDMLRSQEHAQSGQKAVHTERGAFGNPHGAPSVKSHSKKEHERVISELRSMKKPNLLAEGGMIDDEEMMPEDTVHGEQDDSHMMDMIDHIMNKRKMMSEGGKVANSGMGELDEMADGQVNNFDDLSLRDDLESSYTGANSGDEIGNEGEDDRRSDIISRIMASRKKKDRMPRPA